MSLLSMFMIISFKSSLVRLLISNMLYFFLEFCLVPSSEIHPSVSSFFLLLSVYFYVYGINNLIYANDTTLMAESEEELNSLSMRVKEESEKAGLKLTIQKTKIMATGPITSWQTDGEKVEAPADFIFLGSNVTADGDCSHEIERHLLLEIKAMTKLDSILKSRYITLLTKGPYAQRYGFSSSHVYKYERWTIIKAEC